MTDMTPAEKAAYFAGRADQRARDAAKVRAMKTGPAGGSAWDAKLEAIATAIEAYGQ